MEKDKKKFDGVTLDDLARMVADGFFGVNGRIDGLDKRIGGLDNRMDGLDNRMDGLDKRMVGLEEKVEKGFAEINSALNTHVRDVRMQTDALALRTKKLEETVFGVGKYPV